MFEDSNRTLEIVNDNITNFLLAIVDFIEKVKAFFESLTGKEGTTEAAEG